MELDWAKQQKESTAYVQALKEQAEKRKKESEILRSESYVRLKKSEIDRQKRELRRIRGILSQISAQSRRGDSLGFRTASKVRQKEVEIRKFESDYKNKLRMIRDEKTKIAEGRILDTKISQAKIELEKMKSESLKELSQTDKTERQKEQYEMRVKILTASIAALEMDTRQLEGQIMRMKSESRR